MLHSDVQSGEMFDKVTMGIVHYIKQKPGIYDVMFGHYNSINSDLIDSWEEDTCCKLPEDLKNFYLTLNGLLIEWNIELNEEKHPVGRIEVNPLESVVLISKDGINLSDNSITLKDLDIEGEYDINGHKKPLFTDKYFELSSDEAYGKVCLVYKHCKTNTRKLSDCEIWFLDYSLQWYFLAPSFLMYFRMLITHIGIPGWQYLFTDVDLSPDSLLWFSMYLPDRLPSKHANFGQQSNVPKESERNKIDFSTLFKSKASDKKKADQAKQGKNQAVGKPKGTKSGQLRTSHKSFTK